MGATVGAGVGAVVGAWVGSKVALGGVVGTSVAALAAWQAASSRVKIAQAIIKMDTGWRVNPRVFMSFSLF